MKVINFETIKKKADDHFLQLVGLHNIASEATFEALFAAALMTPPRNPRDVLIEWIDKGRELIRQWDIRRVAKLIELFPSCVPAFCHKLPISLDDSGDEWQVVFGA